ncbi:MAG: pirin-like C-terminal cupin domain-containing protein, partial [Stenotrophomonas sp.]
RLLEVAAGSALPLHNSGDDVVQILLLQGVPIGAPVVAYGPFVMNTAEEIEQARRDYGRTQFGGWPWSSHGPVHAAGQGRFAKHPGSDEIELPPVK